MKDRKSILLGILIIIAVVLLTGCELFYNLVDHEEFKEHFGALGYTVSNDEEGLYDSKSYLVASKEDVPFKIEYYEFEDEKDAQKAYKEYKDNIGNYIKTDSKNKETKGAVFTKIVAVSEEEYIVISRVKNTLIVIKGTNDVSEEIDSILEEIRY